MELRNILLRQQSCHPIARYIKQKGEVRRLEPRCHRRTRTACATLANADQGRPPGHPRGDERRRGRRRRDTAAGPGRAGRLATTRRARAEPESAAADPCGPCCAGCAAGARFPGSPRPRRSKPTGRWTGASGEGDQVRLLRPDRRLGGRGLRGGSVRGQPARRTRRPAAARRPRIRRGRCLRRQDRRGAAARCANQRPFLRPARHAGHRAGGWPATRPIRKDASDLTRTTTIDYVE
jgi:hypothetical protein